MPSVTRSARFASSHGGDSSSNPDIRGKQPTGNNNSTDLSDALRDKCVIGAEKPEHRNAQNQSRSRDQKRELPVETNKPKPHSSSGFKFRKKQKQTPPVGCNYEERPKKPRDNRGPRRAIFGVKSLAERRRIKEEKRRIPELY
jgi:hypothetical protein